MRHVHVQEDADAHVTADVHVIAEEENLLVNADANAEEENLLVIADANVNVIKYTYN
jgi:hypothetical protein